MIISRKTSIRRSNRHQIENKESESTIYLYGDIGGWFGIDSKQFVKDLNALESNTIHLRIDSSGGDIFAARAIKTAIMQHPANVIVHIDGLAASAASFLAMGANEIEIVDGGFFMIHYAMSGLDILGYYNIDDLKDLKKEINKEIELHEKINDSIANDYSKRTGLDKETILNYMKKETWFTAQEAFENKFADRIYDGKPIEGSYDLSVFENVPDAVRNRNTGLSIRTIEKALRDAGLTQKEAKAILAEGFRDGGHRDDAPEPESQTPVADHRDGDAKTLKKENEIEIHNETNADRLIKGVAKLGVI